MTRLLLRGVVYALTIYCLCLLALFVFQRQMMYEPIDHIPAAPDHVHPCHPDHIRRAGSVLDGMPRHRKGQKTILFFHGNYGHLGQRIDKMNYWRERGYGFFLFSWRGFSGNPGKPSEDGLYKDADAAIQWLLKQGVKTGKTLSYTENRWARGLRPKWRQAVSTMPSFLNPPIPALLVSAQERYPFFPRHISGP